MKFQHTDQDQHKTLNDVLVAEILPEHGWCRQEAELTDTDKAERTGKAVEIGTLLEPDGGDWKVCRDHDEAVAVLLTHVPWEVHDDGNADVVVLYRGPALVKESGLYLENGTMATALTNMATDSDIEVVEEPDEDEVGLGH